LVRTLILAAGRFGSPAAAGVAGGTEPRVDVLELQSELNADLLDYRQVDESNLLTVRAAKAVSASAGLAALGAQVCDRYDAVLTTGEDIGIPLATLLAGRRRRPAHTMIAHTMTPWKKRLFVHLFGVTRRIDRILCYASSEHEHMTRRLGIPPEKVQRIAYHADTKFFRPMPEIRVEPDLVCSAGQLLRDYDTLLDAVQGVPVRLCIAAGSPWIDSALRPRRKLPANVQWTRLPRHELRLLYARSAVAVVPILDNDYQTGISTILEMMSMGKCVIATRTRGQTDTIVDGVNGLYVPPGDPAALRATIERVLRDPAEAARIGAAARRYIEEKASLELFVSRIADAVRSACLALA
jgi:glycosyltransferase involved in cell wall biosynthesis